MIKVALVSGFWSQNIGNGFFNIGGKWLLEQVFGLGNVQFIQDSPSYRTFYPQDKGVPKNFTNLYEQIDIDYIVLQGPCLTSTMFNIWGPAFQYFQENKVKVILLGASFFKFTEREISDAKEFLKKYPPAIISTRDHRAYSILKDWIPHTYSGIDSAFFVPRAFKPITFKSPFIALNFDRFPEPSIYLNEDCDADFNFEYADKKWSLRVPKVQQYFSMKGKAQAYFGHLLDFRKLPTKLSGFDVIRPEHRFSPHMAHKIYQHPNSFVSDEVFTYFSIYANSYLTLADRVHACVMTLAYGNPAMLFTPSPRQALFARLGLHEIRSKPVRLDPAYLLEEQEGVIQFLGDSIDATS